MGGGANPSFLFPRTSPLPFRRRHLYHCRHRHHHHPRTPSLQVPSRHLPPPRPAPNHQAAATLVVVQPLLSRSPGPARASQRVTAAVTATTWPRRPLPWPPLPQEPQVVFGLTQCPFWWPFGLMQGGECSFGATLPAPTWQHTVLTSGQDIHRLGRPGDSKGFYS